MTETKRPTLPPLKETTSKMLHSYGYDPEAGVLAVKFHNGGVYTYPGVSPEQFAALEGAESIGGHFAKHIRPLGGTKHE